MPVTTQRSCAHTCSGPRRSVHSSEDCVRTHSLCVVCYYSALLFSKRHQQHLPEFSLLKINSSLNIVTVCISLTASHDSNSALTLLLWNNNYMLQINEHLYHVYYGPWLNKYFLYIICIYIYIII